MPGAGASTSVFGRLILLVRGPFGDETSKQMGIILGGQILRRMLGLISSAMLARGLGPVGWSVFSIVGAVVSITSVVSDFGLSSTAVRLIAGARSRGDEEEAHEFTQLFAYLKAGAASLAFGLLLAFAGPLSTLLNLSPEQGPTALRLGGLILFVSSLTGTMSELLRALERFREMVVLQASVVTSLILLLAAPFLSNRLDVPLALALNALSLLLAAFVGYRLLPANWRPGLRLPDLSGNPLLHRLTSFSRWIWFSASFSVLLLHLDLLLLNRFLQPDAVGHYALASNLAFKVSVLTLTMHTVLLPKASTLASSGEYRRYLRANFTRSLILLGMILLILPLVPTLIPMIYGPAFQPAVPLFFGLMIVVLLDLLAKPFLLLAYPLDMPHMLALADGVAVVGLLATAVFAIPLWGLFGAIAARILAQIIRTLLLGITIGRKLKEDQLAL